MGMAESSVSILGNNEELYETTGRKPNPVDVHVGSRVRYRRMIIGMSQCGVILCGFAALFED